jgi:hypothetical protein
VNRCKVLSLLLMTLPLQLAAAAEPITWQGKPLAVVQSISELPQHIRKGFNMNAAAPEGVADIGKPFKTGDVTLEGWHDRGLVGAGHNGDTWVVAMALGRNLGGVAVVAYVLEGTTLLRQERVGFWGDANAFANIVAGLSQPPRPIAQLAGVSIDDSEQQVVAVLGKPTEVIAHEQTYIGDPANKPTNLRITKELRYPGLSIWLRDAIGVMEITASGGNHCQISSICVGATVATVEDELRALGSGGFAPNTSIYSLRHKSSSCQADLSFVAGTVSTIRVRCRP